MYTSDLIKTQKPKLFEVFKINLAAEEKTTQSRPTIPESLELESVLHKAWFDFMDGKKTAEQMLQSARSRIKDLFIKKSYIR